MGGRVDRRRPDSRAGTSRGAPRVAHRNRISPATQGGVEDDGRWGRPMTTRQKIGAVLLSVIVVMTIAFTVYEASRARDSAADAAAAIRRRDEFWREVQRAEARLAGAEKARVTREKLAAS